METKHDHPAQATVFCNVLINLNKRDPQAMLKARFRGSD